MSPERFEFEDIVQAGRVLWRYMMTLYSELKACSYCGKEFKGLAWQKFCSKRCRRNYHLRKRRKKVAGVNPTTNAGGDVS